MAGLKRTHGVVRIGDGDAAMNNHEPFVTEYRNRRSGIVPDAFLIVSLRIAINYHAGLTIIGNGKSEVNDRQVSSRSMAFLTGNNGSWCLFNIKSNLKYWQIT